MLIYLAVPMDAYDDPVDIAGTIGTISRMGHVAYLPSRATVGGTNDPESTYRLNQAALRMADGLLAIWPPMASSWGVPMEVKEKHESGAPVSVIGGESSMQLDAMGVHRVAWDAEGDPVAKAVEWLESAAGRCSLGRARAASASLRTVATNPDGVVLVGNGGSPSPPGIKWAGDPECEPTKGLPGDAGWDLYVSEDTTIPYKGFKDIPCGIRLELPPGVWGRITGRSSTIRKRRLLVNEGIIDNGYRGELFCAVWNMGDGKVEVKRGERIAQLLVHSSLDLRLDRATELTESCRGAAGFGSTGT